MQDELKCPHCGNENVSETGLGHEVSNTLKAKQYQCNSCKEFFSYPRLTRGEELEEASSH